jgi:hypothetical protein
MSEYIETTKNIGYVAVDSGQLILCDPCYIESEWKVIKEYAPSGGSDGNTYPFDYNGACGATMSKEMAGQLDFTTGYPGAGVAFSSGLGDGYYPVYATYIEDPIWGRRISKVEIVLIDYETEDVFPEGDDE